MNSLSHRSGAPTRPVTRWLYALKPASWPKLLVPTLLGQVLGAVFGGVFHVGALLWGGLFTMAGLGFIVLVNDWGDRRVDALKRDMFPQGCSPKTIPDRILSARAVASVGAGLGLVTLLAAAGSEMFLMRPWAFEAGAGCVLLFAQYTLPPVRLNYRGGGELLEMLGVGVALPSYNVYLQAGFVPTGAWPWLVGFAALSLGSAIASGLSDEQSDRGGGKRTVASIYGNRVARMATEASVLVGAAIWALAAILWPDWVPPWAVLPALALLVWRFASMRRWSTRAATNAFEALAAYKHFLHSAIWHSTTVAAALLWLHLAIQ